MLLALICGLSALGVCDAQESATLLTDGSIRLTVKETRGRFSCVTVEPQDEVWLLSARNVNCNPADLSVIEVKQMVEGQWLTSSLAELTSAHSANRTLSTMIYTHGNNTDESWARSRGLQVYDKMFVTPGTSRPPVRFVIFAWRSEKEEIGCGQYLAKSKRAVQVGKSLAAVLTQFDDRNIVLAGFSLGSQVVLAALDDKAIQMEFDSPGKYRVFLLAPALDGLFVNGTTSRSHSSEAVERAEIFNNSVDRALKASRFVSRKVLGRNGNLSISDLVDNQGLALAGIRLQDVADQVGRRHSVVRYSSRQVIQQEIQIMLREAYAAGQDLPIWNQATDVISNESILLAEPDLIEPSTTE